MLRNPQDASGMAKTTTQQLYSPMKPPQAGTLMVTDRATVCSDGLLSCGAEAKFLTLKSLHQSPLGVY